MPALGRLDWFRRILWQFELATTASLHMPHPFYHTSFAAHVQYQNSGGLGKPKKNKKNYFLLMLILRITETWKSSVAYSNRLKDCFRVWEVAVACSKVPAWKENDHVHDGTQGSINRTVRKLLSNTPSLLQNHAKDCCRPIPSLMPFQSTGKFS